MRPTHAGLFHVTSRSIAEEHIFRDDRDYAAGVQILAELATEKFFDCHGFCLMPTHYHVFASFRENMLSDAIHRLNRRYAGGFNRRHRRRGHVFDSPFASVAVVTEQHAFHLPDYLAENPPYRPWPWSSFDAEFSFVEPFETHEPGSKSEPGSNPFARNSASADSVFFGDSPIAARM
jgi:REP element-mobilizing transposase RayT